jgi:MFS-type transporter involved in bile tolerance (Atg22 family)
MQYGIFQSIVVLGGLGMPFLFPSIAKKINIENIFVYGLFSISIILGGITFTYSEFFIKLCGGTIIPYIAFIVLTILVINATLMMNQTIFQQLIPRNMMGRVVSVMSTVCMAAMPMGQWMMGNLLDSVNSIYIGIGVCMIIFIVAAAYKFVVNASVKEEVDNAI